MRKRSPEILTLLTPLVLTLAALTLTPPARAQQDFHFAIAPSFLETLAEEDSLLTTLEIRMDGRSGLHGLASDCEMHIAGMPTLNIGAPRAVVVEPPNLCKFGPGGVLNARGIEKKWEDLFDRQVIARRCDATGFFRIFTEHAQGGSGVSNPDHVFEIHPALSIDCGQEISFGNMLKAFPGMSAIQPASADSCIAKRQLEVRFKRNRYEFRHNKAGRCGNFAIIRVNSVTPAQVSRVGGGHAATAQVTADGRNERTLKVYTLTGSDADDWLSDVNANGMGGRRVMLHGIITYDYRAIIGAVRGQGGRWMKPADWAPVNSPLALVILGRTETVPWR
jgi:hypothetical protein